MAINSVWESNSANYQSATLSLLHHTHKEIHWVQAKLHIKLLSGKKKLRKVKILNWISVAKLLLVPSGCCKTSTCREACSCVSSPQNVEPEVTLRLSPFLWGEEEVAWKSRLVRVHGILVNCHHTSLEPEATFFFPAEKVKGIQRVLTLSIPHLIDLLNI